MFFRMKKKEYMDSELSGIFRANVVAKNIVLWSPGTHFMHMRVKKLGFKVFIFIFVVAKF